MATSKSRENAAGSWIGIARLFSGRPDPTWDVAAADVEQLQKIWDSLEPWKGHIPRSAPLGYRGCEVHGPDRTELHAFGGVATMKGAGIRREPDTPGQPTAPRTSRPGYGAAGPDPSQRSRSTGITHSRFTRSKTFAKRCTIVSSTSRIDIDRWVTFSSDVTPRSEMPHGTMSRK